MIVVVRIHLGSDVMEQACQICGLSEENIVQLIDKKVIRVCENCLQDEKINPFLDQLLREF
jgi:hypothetical protein